MATVEDRIREQQKRRIGMTQAAPRKPEEVEVSPEARQFRSSPSAQMAASDRHIADRRAAGFPDVTTADVHPGVPSAAEAMIKHEYRQGMEEIAARGAEIERRWKQGLPMPEDGGHASVPPEQPRLGPRGSVSGTTSRPAAPRPAPRIQQIGDPHERTPQAAPAAPSYRTVTSRGGHTLEAEIAGYDNARGVVLLRDRTGREIPVPHEEVDYETLKAAHEGTRYSATEDHLNSVKGKRGAVAGARANGAKPVAAPTQQASLVPNITKPAVAPATPRPMVPNVTQPLRAPAAPQPTDPHSQAQAMLADLNNRRRQAGGEVPDAPQVLARVSRLQAEGDAIRNARPQQAAAPRPAAKPVAAKPAAKPLPPGMVRVNGVVGEIAAHDPEAGMVRIAAPGGQSTWVAVADLDDHGRKAYASRIGEHNGRVEYEQEKKAFEDVNGEGTWDHRHAYENAYPELRGPDGRGGTRLAARRALQSQVQTQELTSDHNRQMAALRGRLNGGAAAAQVQPQPAPEPVPVKAQEVAQKVVEQQAQPQAQPKPTAPEKSPVEKLWHKVAREYANNLGKFTERGITLDEHFEAVAAAEGLAASSADIHPSVYERTHNMLDARQDYDRRRENARNNWHWAALGRGGREKVAHQIINNPNSTPQEVANAHNILGNWDAASQTIAADAAVRAAKHKADADIAAAGANGRGGKPEAAPVQDVAYAALGRLPQNASIESRSAAVRAALINQPGNQMTPEEAASQAETIVEGPLWQQLSSADPIPLASPEGHFFWRTTIQRGGPVRDPDNPAKVVTPPTMTEAEFVAMAMGHGVRETDARRRYAEFTRPRGAAATQVGTNDAPAITTQADPTPANRREPIPRPGV